MQNQESNKYSTTPLAHLLAEMAQLEQEINMKLLVYEEMRREVVKRFPIIEKEECFQEKQLTLKKGK